MEVSYKTQNPENSEFFCLCAGILQELRFRTDPLSKEQESLKTFLSGFSFSKKQFYKLPTALRSETDLNKKI